MDAAPDSTFTASAAAQPHAEPRQTESHPASIPQQSPDGAPTSEQSSSRPEGRGRHSRPPPRSGRGHDRGRRQGKKGDLGRNEWSKRKGDRRSQNTDSQDRAEKRQKLATGDEKGLPVYATKFSEAELKDEERRPKKKVAVMIGYSGTGYKGMQMAHDQKTIEGDLFKAFVAAGAISKANADDPKKSSFVRCARTDKGVHAAGNVISLKLIVEDHDIIQKINDNLSKQIRVWGFERTNNSFSAYHMVDSRIYEYLIPTHAFLPPHPRSYLGRKCDEWAEKKGDTDAWEQRQREVEGYWEKVDEESIAPILATYDDEIRSVLEKALWLKAEEEAAAQDNEGGSIVVTQGQQEADDSATSTMTPEERRARSMLIFEGTKKLRHAYVNAKRAYRIDSTRLERVREALNIYVGTKNYHNYTIQKTYNDPSANRVMKSFVVHGSPILINGTEWLSLKVHGQSFMMHQIRKMVGMAALVVRCGCDPQRIVQSFGRDDISIPKAPSLGLLLERPIFDSYNKKATRELAKEAIDFTKYEKDMDEFKQREIYDRMHADEERDNIFGNFFNHVDNFPSETFLFVTSGGIDATKVADEGASKTSTGEKPKLAPVKVGEDGDEADSDEDNVRDDAGNEG